MTFGQTVYIPFSLTSVDDRWRDLLWHAQTKAGPSLASWSQANWGATWCMCRSPACSCYIDDDCYNRPGACAWGLAVGLIIVAVGIGVSISTCIAARRAHWNSFNNAAAYPTNPTPAYPAYPAQGQSAYPAYPAHGEPVSPVPGQPVYPEHQGYAASSQPAYNAPSSFEMSKQGQQAGIAASPNNDQNAHSNYQHGHAGTHYGMPTSH